MNITTLRFESLMTNFFLVIGLEHYSLLQMNMTKYPLYGWVNQCSVEYEHFYISHVLEIEPQTF